MILDLLSTAGSWANVRGARAEKRILQYILDILEDMGLDIEPLQYTKAIEEFHNPRIAGPVVLFQVETGAFSSQGNRIRSDIIVRNAGGRTLVIEVHSQRVTGSVSQKILQKVCDLTKVPADERAFVSCGKVACAFHPRVRDSVLSEDFAPNKHAAIAAIHFLAANELSQVIHDFLSTEKELIAQ